MASDASLSFLIGDIQQTGQDKVVTQAVAEGERLRERVCLWQVPQVGCCGVHRCVRCYMYIHVQMYSCKGNACACSGRFPLP